MSNVTKDPVHPYYRAILDAYAESGRPYYHQVTPERAREMLLTSQAAAPPQTDLPEMVLVRDEVLAGKDGDIPIRRYVPTGDLEGLCLYFHAGGWVIGDLDTADPLCRRLAHIAGCELVSVDYRLAPEHPYPAALDDAFAALQWAVSLQKGAIVLAGESAGANLAAACTIRARHNAPLQIAGQVLIYPVLDHDFTTGSYRELGGCNYLLSEADMRWFWDSYCPPGVNRDDPLVSPLRVASAVDLPSALICVAELDPLRDEGLAYAALLAADGVDVQSRCDEGMLHGYLSAAGSIPAAADAVKQAGEWMRQHLRGRTS